MTQFVRRRRAWQPDGCIYIDVSPSVSESVYLVWVTARNRYVCYASWGVVPQKGLRTQSTLMEAAFNADSTSRSSLSLAVSQ